MLMGFYMEVLIPDVIQCTSVHGFCFFKLFSIGCMGLKACCCLTTVYMAIAPLNLTLPPVGLSQSTQLSSRNTRTHSAPHSRQLPEVGLIDVDDGQIVWLVITVPGNGCLS